MYRKPVIGILGGTFNPIHCGHLRAAIEVREICGLAQVIMIPAAVPPHKEGRNLASPEHRLAMTAMAVADIPEVEYSDVEIKRLGTSYTIDTWRYYKDLMGADANLKLILGREVFLEIHTWHHFEELLSEAEFIVTNRPFKAFDRDADLLDRYLATTLSAFSPKLETVNVPELSISSREVRAKITAGHSIRFLVPQNIANYIHEKGLYK